jgi:predicted Ser/Thr protein kinase
VICPGCQADNDPDARACLACGETLGSASSSPAVGNLFAARYEIVGPLGRGGMGMVYRAWDRELRETVALKMIRPDLVRQRHIEHRFRSEVKLARRVRHPNVCSIYGDGEDRGLLYISMEFVDGTDLHEVVRNGDLSPAEAYDVAMQIAEGLAAIHEVGIIHRDLKTANIMRDRRGVVRLMDFGIAKKSQAEGTTAATATGQVLGTPEYMSPEQIRGHKVDFRTDVYALGIVVYEIFTGTVPFRGETAVATIFKQLQDPPPLSIRGPRALPRSLVPVLRRALSKEPGPRFPSATEMRVALGRARDEYRVAPDTLDRSVVTEETEDVATVHGTGTTLSDAAATKEWSAARRDTPALRYAVAAVAATFIAGGLWAWWPAAAPESKPNAATAPLAMPSPSRVGPRALPAGVYDEGDNRVTPKPQKLSGRLAEYPQDGTLLKRGDLMMVTVVYVVSVDGNVTDLDVIIEGSDAPRSMDAAVRAAYSRWKFSPGLVGGIPVPVRSVRRQTFIGG